MKRIYVDELEKKYGIQILMPYSELKGRRRDGITEKQKQALRNFGVNTTGFRYKSEATKALKFLIENAQNNRPPVWMDISAPDTIWRIKKLGQKNTMSRELFATESDAEYYCARVVSPDYDVKIFNYRFNHIWVVAYDKKKRYFARKDDAYMIHAKHGGFVWKVEPERRD